MIKTDVDIDLADRKTALSVIPHIVASVVKSGVATPHNTGVYFQNITVNPLNGLASLDYETAEDCGYFKLDFINNRIYEGIRDEAHLDELINREPDWSLLESKDFVSILAHVHDHFDIVESIKPKSIHDLAVVLAMIRPGKRYLVGKDRATIDAEVWVPPADGSYHFKKAHSYSYALSIMVQMNHIQEILENEQVD